MVPYGDLVTSWSEWLPVTTPDVWISDVYDVDLDMLADDIKGWQLWAGEGLREVERRLEEFDLWMADQDLGSAYVRQEIRQQLTATFDNARAEWKYDVTVVAAENYALAQRVEQLTADVGNNSAAITSEATARANADTALAADITTLEASVFNPTTGLPAVASAVDVLEAYAGPGGVTAQAIPQLSASTDPNNTAQANYRAQVVAGPSGYSRIVFQTRYGGAGAWRGAAFGLDTPANAANPTRFWADAQNFVFYDTSSGATINPLIYSGGVWRMNVAHIGTVTSGTIKSPNDKFIINLSAGSIEWFD